MNKTFGQKCKGFLHSWNMALICILIAEFIVFGAKNPKPFAAAAAVQLHE